MKKQRDKLLTAPIKIRCSDSAWWYEEPSGIYVVMRGVIETIPFHQVASYVDANRARIRAAKRKVKQ